jgi:hypothetical protein
VGGHDEMRWMREVGHVGGDVRRSLMVGVAMAAWDGW